MLSQIMFPTTNRFQEAQVLVSFIRSNILFLFHCNSSLNMLLNAIICNPTTKIFKLAYMLHVLTKYVYFTVSFSRDKHTCFFHIDFHFILFGKSI